MEKSIIHLGLFHAFNRGIVALVKHALSVCVVSFVSNLLVSNFIGNLLFSPVEKRCTESSGWRYC